MAVVSTFITLQQIEPWSGNGAIGLPPLVTVCKQQLPIRIEEIGRAQLTHPGRKISHHRQSHLRVRRAILPDRIDPVHQHTEGTFGVGFTDGGIVPCRETFGVVDGSIQVPVMGKEVHSPRRLPLKRLCIAQGQFPLSGVTDMRQK